MCVVVLGIVLNFSSVAVVFVLKLFVVICYLFGGCDFVVCYF